MGSIGLPELIVVVLLVGMLTVPFILKRRFPGRLWLGVTLAFLLGPWGHWYLERGVIYVLAVWALAVLLGLLILSASLSWVVTCLMSALLMYYRFGKRRQLAPEIKD